MPPETPAPPWMTSAVLCFGVSADMAGRASSRARRTTVPRSMRKAPDFGNASLLALMAQRLDRVELRRLARGIEAEEQARRNGTAGGQRHHLPVELDGQLAEFRDRQRAQHADQHAQHAAAEADQHRLG